MPAEISAGMLCLLCKFSPGYSGLLTFWYRNCFKSDKVAEISYASKSVSVDVRVPQF